MNKEMMQESGVDWIGAIPPGWKVERLKKVSTIKSSNVDKKDYPDQIPVRLCNYVDVYYNDVIDSSIKYMKSTASDLECKKFHLSAGDVVLTKDSETPDDIAVPAYVAENIDDLVCGYHLAVMQANHKLDGKFLFRAIQSTGIKEQFYRLATGITRFGLKIRELESVLIPLPPIAEQLTIARYLDQRCGKLDAIIAIKQQQIKTLDAFRQSIIYHAVTKGLDESVRLVDSGVEWLGKIPQGWRVSRVKDILDFYNTKRIPLSSADRGIMTNKEYDYYGASGVIDKVDNYIFDGIYILVAEDGANLLSRSTALAFIAKGKFWVNNHAHILKPRFGDITFFTNLLESMDYSLFVTGAAQPKLTKDNLGNFKILNPPLTEQHHIADYIDQETQRLDDLKANLSHQINTLEAYKKALIYECVTGKKRIKAEDLKAG